MMNIAEEMLNSRNTDIVPYAASALTSLGRQFEETGCPMRSPFQRDRDRIVHASAFRRLTHKTQVFIYHEGDHYRTRLTHTLEVAQIARSIARMLHLEEDLTEAIALAHDLGHSPFGHAGEKILNALMQEHGGFDHNAQSLKHVTRLEQKYPNFDGLNLSYECLEGLAKHNGPPLGTGQSLDELPPYIKSFNEGYNLQLHKFALLEAQVAAIADDIAYSNHDIDDGLRADLITISDLEGVEITKIILEEIRLEYGVLAKPRLINELNRRLITWMVADIVGETERRLREGMPKNVEDVRLAVQSFVGFSSSMMELMAELREFLFTAVYRDKWVIEVMGRASQVVEDLFLAYQKDQAQMPAQWQSLMQSDNPDINARHICDFVAGMTDRFALLEHRRLFDATPDLR